MQLYEHCCLNAPVHFVRNTTVTCLLNSSSSSYISKIRWTCPASLANLAFVKSPEFLKSVESQVDGRCAPRLASLHPYQTPFVLIPGFLRRTQSAPLINLGTPSAPPNIRGTQGVLNLECTF